MINLQKLGKISPGAHNLKSFQEGPTISTGGWSLAPSVATLLKLKKLTFRQLTDKNKQLHTQKHKKIDNF